MAEGLAAPPTGELRRGWRVLVGAAVGMGLGAGLFSYVLSLFVIEYQREFGWSRGQIALVQAIPFLGVMTAPIIGSLLDRFGFRPVVTTCTLATAALYLGLAWQPGGIVVFQALAIGLGMVAAGSTAMVYARPVVAVFDRRRGLALGLFAAGASFSAILAPPFLEDMISEHGWRAGHYAMAGLTAGVGLPLALLLIGRAARDTRSPLAPAVRRKAIGGILRTASFWLVALFLFSVNFAGTGALGQMAALLQDKGLTPDRAALGLSIFAIGVLCGRLACGWLIDHLPPPLVAAGFTLAPAVGCVLLLNASPAVAVAAAAVFLIGLQQGSEIDVVGILVSRRFGLESFGSVYGLLIALGVVGSATGIATFGAVHDRAGSYDPALAAGAVAFVFAAATLFVLSRLPGRPPA